MEKLFYMFMAAFLLCAALIVAITEAIKRRFGWSGKVVSGVTSVLVPVLVSAAYMVVTETTLDGRKTVFIIGLIFISWLGATLGFDKASDLIYEIYDIIARKKKISPTDREPDEDTGENKSEDKSNESK